MEAADSVNKTNGTKKGEKVWKNENKPDFGTLSDLKVVSASSSLAGPFIARNFAEYGTDGV